MPPRKGAALLWARYFISAGRNAKPVINKEEREMAKQLMFNEEARRKLLEGVEQISRAVNVTLVPKGRNVLLDKKFGAPTITKDGVSVAKEV